MDRLAHRQKIQVGLGNPTVPPRKPLHSLVPQQGHMLRAMRIFVQYAYCMTQCELQKKINLALDSRSF